MAFSEAGFQASVVIVGSGLMTQPGDIKFGLSDALRL